MSTQTLNKQARFNELKQLYIAYSKDKNLVNLDWQEFFNDLAPDASLFLKDQINPVLSPFSFFFVVFLAFLVASRVFPSSLARFAPPLSFSPSFSPLSFVFLEELRKP